MQTHSQGHTAASAPRHTHPGTRSHSSWHALLHTKIHLDPRAGKTHKLSLSPLPHTPPQAHWNSCRDGHTRTYFETHRKTLLHTLASSLRMWTERPHLCQTQCHFSPGAETRPGPRAWHPLSTCLKVFGAKTPFLPWKGWQAAVWEPSEAKPRCWGSWGEIQQEGEPEHPSSM